MSSLRQKAGALLLDFPRFAAGIRGRQDAWIRIRNRTERLIAAADGRGVACQWKWTSDLHICQVFPSNGRRLAGRAFSRWPVRLAAEPLQRANPRVSFIVGHRGAERIPNLLTTISSIAGQTDAAIECVVVEQSSLAEVGHLLPSWVKYVHTQSPEGVPYSRAWALNVGARHAAGEILILHDNDVLVPAAYAREVASRVAEGSDFVDLKRFTFYLDESYSKRIIDSQRITLDAPIDTVVQNLQGASIAARREAFAAIGGFDESFLGWGGEDNEFWERARTRAVYAYGYLPMLHLWHAPQPEKGKEHAPAIARYHELADLPPAERISILSSRRWGMVEGPVSG